MQVTVAQLNRDIVELQKSLGLKNARLDEAATLEDDLRRQLNLESEMVHRRDRQIDDYCSEITSLRKQIEDQYQKISEIETLKSELTSRFEDLRIQF